MRTLFVILGLATLITGCSSTGRPGVPLNVIVLGQVSQEHYTGSSRSVHRRITRGISNPISDAGHHVYDETLTTLDDFDITGNLSRAALLDIARSVRPRMDVVVLFNFSSSTRSRASSRQVNISIDATAIDVSSGRTRGSANSTDSFRVAPNCNGNCLRDRLGDEAKTLAAHVGASIAARLGDVAGGGTGRGEPGRGFDGAFEISLDGFASWEARDIEDSLETLKGYTDHRITFSNSRRVDIWYETRASVSKISRALDKVLDELGVRGNVQFSGNKFRVTKISLRPKPAPKDNSDWEW